VDDGQWERETAESISAALMQQADSKPKDQQVLANPDNPTSTWIVQTNQGGVAILKVKFRKDIKTDTSGIVEGFIVRYKLATTKHGANAPAANASSERWGDEFNGLQCRMVPVSPSMDAGQVDMATPWTRFESPDEITFAIEIKKVSGKPIKLKDIRYGTGNRSLTTRVHIGFTCDDYKQRAASRSRTESITLTSETGRQRDQLYIKIKEGKDIDVKDAFFTGESIDVRWTLRPGDVAELDVLTPSLHQDLPPGEYSVRYNVRFHSRQSKDEQGDQTFPTPGDYQSETLTGWYPLFLRDPNLQSAE